MKVDAVRAKALVSQLQEVQHRIANVAKGQNVSFLCVCTQHTHQIQCNLKPHTLVSRRACCRCRDARRPAMPDRTAGGRARCGGNGAERRKHSKSFQTQTTQKTDALGR